MTYLQSVLNLKCPRCRKGDLFKTPSFSYSKPIEMPERCEVCKQHFHPEPGFYYGAMFIGYIFTAFFAITFVIFMHWVLGLSINWSFAALITIFLVFFIYIFRLARSIWIHIVVKYDEEIAK